MVQIVELGPNDVIFRGKKVFIKNKTGKMGMLFVGAEWCGHCVSFKPIYEQFSKIVNDFDLYHMDSEVCKSILSKMNVEGFPTIFNVSASGELERYYEPRDLFSLTKEFCKRVRTGDICKTQL